MKQVLTYLLRIKSRKSEAVWKLNLVLVQVFKQWIAMYSSPVLLYIFVFEKKNQFREVPLNSLTDTPVFGSFWKLSLTTTEVCH